MGYAAIDIFNRLLQFMDAGGWVLWLIALVTFLMWSLIFERIWYFHTGMRREIAAAAAAWSDRAERDSWQAKSIRRALVSRLEVNIRHNLPLVRTLVALCPLLGLLGTVTGMIDVFNVLSVTGGGDARAMAEGVSRATIPTRAGMVAALAGVFANSYIERVALRETQLLEDHLTRGVA
jgi:biopolymer transport protein ExbB